MKQILILLALLLASCTEVSTACPESQKVVLPPDDTTACNMRSQAGNSCTAQCPFGQPVHRCDAFKPCTSPIVVKRGQYELGYSPDKGVPLWVCETVDPGELQGPAQRRSSFSLDPLLPRSYHSAPGVYTGSGFDRGHLAAAANQKWSQKFMNQTFYISNVAPMAPRFNRAGGAWYKLEQWVRELAVRYNEKVYVISGPAFFTWRLALGTAGLEEVRVPSHYYKIVVAKRGTKSWQAIAFTAKNEDKVFTGGSMFDGVGDLINSIDNIEQITGLDFLPTLGQVAQKELEEKRANWLLWSKK